MEAPVFSQVNLYMHIFTVTVCLLFIINFQQVPSASTNFIRISIESHSLADEGGEKFTLFNISIQTAFSTWEITRRYRQFLALHQELLQKIPHVKFPSLPKRKVLGSSLQPSFVEDRKQALESYLQTLVSIPEVWSCARFIEFLDDSQSFLGIQVQMTRSEIIVVQFHTFV